MASHITGALTHYWQIVGAFDFEHFVLHPLTVLPAPHSPSELAEVNFRIKVGSKIMPVIASVYIDDVDIANTVEIFDSKRCVCVDHAWVKANSENSGNVFFFTQLTAFPFIVRVPGRCFANFVRVFMDGCIEIGSASFDT